MINSDLYFLYDEITTLIILKNKKYHNTSIYKMILRDLNINYNNFENESDIIKSKVDYYISTLLENEVRLGEFVKRVNRIVIIKMISNYYDLENKINTIDDFLTLQKLLQKLCIRDRTLLLGYYNCKYSLEELEEINRKKHLRMTRQNISQKINDVIDYLVNELMKSE